MILDYDGQKILKIVVWILSLIQNLNMGSAVAMLEELPPSITGDQHSIITLGAFARSLHVLPATIWVFVGCYSSLPNPFTPEHQLVDALTTVNCPWCVAERENLGRVDGNVVRIIKLKMKDEYKCVADHKYGLGGPKSLCLLLYFQR